MCYVVDEEEDSRVGAERLLLRSDVVEMTVSPAGKRSDVAGVVIKTRGVKVLAEAQSLQLVLDQKRPEIIIIRHWLTVGAQGR